MISGLIDKGVEEKAKILVNEDGILEKVKTNARIQLNILKEDLSQVKEVYDKVFNRVIREAEKREKEYEKQIDKLYEKKRKIEESFQQLSFREKKSLEDLAKLESCKKFSSCARECLEIVKKYVFVDNHYAFVEFKEYRKRYIAKVEEKIREHFSAKNLNLKDYLEKAKELVAIKQEIQECYDEIDESYQDDELYRVSEQLSDSEDLIAAYKSIIDLVDEIKQTKDIEKAKSLIYTVNNYKLTNIIE